MAEKIELFKCEDGSLFNPYLVMKVERNGDNKKPWHVGLNCHGNTSFLYISQNDYERFIKIMVRDVE